MIGDQRQSTSQFLFLHIFIASVALLVAFAVMLYADKAHADFAVDDCGTLLAGPLAPRTLGIAANRQALLKFLYQEDLIEASPFTRKLGDKLFMAKLLEHHLGADFAEFHPKSLGVKEFLVRHKLINKAGRVIASRQEIESAFAKEFPKGFIIKPTFDWDSNGLSFFKDPARVFSLLIKGDSDLYSAREFKQRFAPEGQEPLSGERWFIMEKIEGTTVIAHDSAYGKSNEFRVHAFYDKIIEGGTITRWYDPVVADKAKLAEKFVQKLLDKLPTSATYRQAWSFDVFIEPSGRLRLIEVNTNRGERGGWSSFISQPEVLGAYVRHFEKYFGWQFTGVHGELLRQNLGHSKVYIKNEILYSIEEAIEMGVSEQVIIKDLQDLYHHYIGGLKKFFTTRNLPIPEDVQRQIDFGEVFFAKVRNIKKIGDPAWQELVAWSKTLEDI